MSVGVHGDTGLATPTASQIAAQARRRRTFAVISHPDAGKSTLTEALVLHAKIITAGRYSLAARSDRCCRFSCSASTGSGAC